MGRRRRTSRSILPGPVGPNPSTIAAVAHRAAERLIADAG